MLLYHFWQEFIMILKSLKINDFFKKSLKINDFLKKVLKLLNIIHLQFENITSSMWKTFHVTQ